jgi:uncharacterized protein
MAAPASIASDSELWAPVFEVRLRGRTLDPRVVHDVLEVSYHDSLDEIDGFTLTLSNWDAASPTYDELETRTFKYSDGGIFDPGEQIELRMGYRDDPPLELMLTGEITSLSPSFPASGPPTLKVGGLNVLHRLRRRQVSHAYTNATDAEIATEVAGRLEFRANQFEADTSSNERYEYVLQDNQYDIVFLLGRARRIGYDLIVDESSGRSVLKFKPSPKVRQSVYRLGYGATLQSFEPTLTTARQVSKVTVLGWDAVRKEVIRATVDRSQLPVRGVSDPADQQTIDRAYGNREEVISNRPVHTLGEAQTLARQTLERIVKDLVTARAATVGVPRLRAGTVVQLDGLGARFSGRYFVTSTTHTIGAGGYATSFECRREEL